MDEGINSFNETRYLLDRHGDNGIDLDLFSSKLSDKWMERLDLSNFEYRWIDELAYIFPARLGTDQPLQCHSDAFTSMNYGAIAYKKTAAVFAFLRQYLGTERFDKAMQQYFEDWKFKHPSPIDMRTSLENSCGEDLGWFFDGFIDTAAKNDWAISSVKRNNTSTSVTVKNKGEMTSPVEVVAYNGDNEVGRVWVEPSGPGSIVDVVIPGSGTTNIVIDPGRYDLDYDRQNNNARTKGILRKVEPAQIRLGTRLEDGTKTQVFWLPAIAWNDHNKMMFGATIHNTTVPLRDLEWMVTPLINKNVQLSGLSRLSYHTGPWSINLKAQRFSTDEYIDDSITNDTDPAPMNRISFSILRKLNKVQNSNWESKVKVETVVVNGFMDSDNYSETPFRSSYSLAFDAIKKRGKLIGLQQEMGIETRQFITMENQIEPQPLGGKLLYQDVFNISTAYYEATKRISNSSKRIKLNILSRVIFHDEEVAAWNGPNNNAQIPTSGYGAQFDPMADNLLLNRGATSGFLSTQTQLEHGALPVNYFANNWMTSAKLEFEFSESLSVFAGALVYDDINFEPVAGITYDLGPLQIHMPLYSNEILAEGTSYEPYKHWMFSLNLHELSPWGLARETN